MRFDLILATLCVIQSVALIAVSLKARKLVRLMRRRERYNAGLMREAARQLTTYHERLNVLEDALRKFGVPCAAGGDYCALCSKRVICDAYSGALHQSNEWIDSATGDGGAQ